MTLLFFYCDLFVILLLFHGVCIHIISLQILEIDVVSELGCFKSSKCLEKLGVRIRFFDQNVL